jgi:hypothetical protein
MLPFANTAVIGRDRDQMSTSAHSFAALRAYEFGFCDSAVSTAATALRANAKAFVSPLLRLESALLTTSVICSRPRDVGVYYKYTPH